MNRKLPFARVAVGCLLVAGWCAGWTSAADRIVLRSLKILSDRTVASFDEDGVKLDDGSAITWDEIERGSVDESKQASFDKLVEELGEPLYRIRQRLKNGDYEGLLEQAEAVYPRYISRDSSTAYMVFQSLMWGRLATGQREAAVEPYLYAYEYLRTQKTTNPDLPGDRRLKFDPATAMSSALPPVWFDADAAKAALPGVYNAVKKMKSPRPEGVYIYYATLASAAGDAKTANEYLGFVQGDKPLITQWRDVATAQIEILSASPGVASARLESSIDRFLPETKLAALYWLGMSKVASNDKEIQKDGVLKLLHLPAVYGKHDPELAGAGLFQAMVALDKLDDIKGSIALRKELMVRYAHTVYAAKVKAESDPVKVDRE